MPQHLGRVGGEILRHKHPQKLSIYHKFHKWLQNIVLYQAMTRTIHKMAQYSRRISNYFGNLHKNDNSSCGRFMPL